MTQYEVTEYADLTGAKLSEAGRDKVLAALADGYDAVLFAEDWIIDEKGLNRLEGTARLVGLRGIDAETDKAWLVLQGDTEAWVPKSQGELYLPGEG